MNIRYPDDKHLIKQARDLGIPPIVLIRDIVRIVEIISLRDKDFFNKKSVLAGSMALRTFNSPRFTVYDADFSTTSETVSPPTKMTDLLSYSDSKLDITPANAVPYGDDGSTWKSAPIAFTARFTRVPIPAYEQTFKADISFRGLVRDGMERPLHVPYDLGLWDEGDEPSVFIMDLHETIAEKVLGWCAHRQVKHYADLAYIAYVAAVLKLDYGIARSVLGDKLAVMSDLHPGHYAAFPTVESLIDDLEQKPLIAPTAWQRVVYLRAYRDRFHAAFIEQQVRTKLAPSLRASDVRLRGRRGSV